MNLVKTLEKKTLDAFLKAQTLSKHSVGFMEKIWNSGAFIRRNVDLVKNVKKIDKHRELEERENLVSYCEEVSKERPFNNCRKVSLTFSRFCWFKNDCNNLETFQRNWSKICLFFSQIDKVQSKLRKIKLFSENFSLIWCGTVQCQQMYLN